MASTAIAFGLSAGDSRHSLYRKGARTYFDTGDSRSFTIQASVADAGAWGGAVLTVRVSNDSTNWIDHPDGLTLTADGITPSRASHWKFVGLETTTVASADANAGVVLALSDSEPDTSAATTVYTQQDQACMYPVLPDDGGSFAGFTAISGTAYFLYMGRTITTLTPRFVEYMVAIAGSGAQTMELGLFSTPLAPNAGSQAVTKLVATGTCTSNTSTGTKGNTSAFAVSVPAGTHLWAGGRWAMATTQPTIANSILYDLGLGAILTTAASGVLTGAGPWTGAVPASTYAAFYAGPMLRVRI